MSMKQSTTQPHILIGTPCYGGLIHEGYVRSFADTITNLPKHGVNVGWCFLANESLIPRGRNSIAAKFMANKSYTHLLFIDADITWRWEDILKLLRHNKPLIGGAYPKKSYYWDRLPKAAQQLVAAGKKPEDWTEEDLTFLRKKMTKYVMNFATVPGTDRIDNRVDSSLLRVKHFGTGFMMISREVFEKMAERYPDCKHVDDVGFLRKGNDQWLYSFFNAEVDMTQPEGERHYLSEDWLFCKRWCEEMGNDIYIDVTIKLTHTGSETWGGSVLESMGLHSSTGSSTPVTRRP